MDQRVDAIVALAGGVVAGELSPEGTDRLNAAIAVARSGVAPLIVTTRDHADGLIGRVIADARSGVEWRIAGETICRTTADEAEAVARLLPQGASIVLVTTRYHAQRARATFARAGFRVTMLIAPEVRYRAPWTRYVRDGIGLLWYRLRGWA